MERTQGPGMRTATEEGLTLCRDCGTLTDRQSGSCSVCGAQLRPISEDSLQSVWAYWVAGVLVYIPGNLYPIMVTETVSGRSESTIIGGVITLLHHGSYAIAAVIFLASIVVPVSKFMVIGYLALSVRGAWPGSAHVRHRVYHAVELVGRWSMVDVFVVAALAALIQIGGLIAITPGVGINAFALSVVFTMLSAASFDPRLIWRHSPEPIAHHHG